ncbi:hypothetical protein [Nostoc sp.]
MLLFQKGRENVLRHSLKIWRSLTNFGGFDDRKPWCGSFTDF